MRELLRDIYYVTRGIFRDFTPGDWVAFTLFVATLAFCAVAGATR